MAKFGHIVTAETRLKLRLANLGKKQSPSTIEKKRVIALGNKYALGHRHNEETRRRMSLSHTGKKIPADRIRHLIGNKHMLGKKHSEETKRRMGEARSGSRNGNWKEGVTPINRSIRTSKPYKEWRKSVFERDDYTCTECGARSGVGNKVILNADHIKPFSLYPELRFNLDNGRTLCTPCHKLTDTFAGKIRQHD